MPKVPTSPDAASQVRLHDLDRIRSEQQKMDQSLAKLGTTEWNPETDEVSWSDETYRILGLDPCRDELTRDRIGALFPRPTV